MTVLIGIAVKGRAVAGVIYQPYYNYQAGPGAKLGRCIWGIVGTGKRYVGVRQGAVSGVIMCLSACHASIMA